MKAGPLHTLVTAGHRLRSTVPQSSGNAAKLSAARGRSLSPMRLQVSQLFSGGSGRTKQKGSGWVVGGKCAGLLAAKHLLMGNRLPIVWCCWDDPANTCNTRTSWSATGSSFFTVVNSFLLLSVCLPCHEGIFETARDGGSLLDNRQENPVGRIMF